MGHYKGKDKWHHTDATKRRISESLMGRTDRLTKEGKDKLALRMLQNNPMKTVYNRERQSALASGDNNPSRKYNVGKLREQHDKEVERQAKILSENGYKTVIVGKWQNPLPDVIAFKDNQVIGVEVTTRKPNPEKWDSNCPFDKVTWVYIKKIRLNKDGTSK